MRLRILALVEKADMFCHRHFPHAWSPQWLCDLADMSCDPDDFRNSGRAPNRLAEWLYRRLR